MTSHWDLLNCINLMHEAASMVFRPGDSLPMAVDLRLWRFKNGGMDNGTGSTDETDHGAKKNSGQGRNWLADK